MTAMKAHWLFLLVAGCQLAAPTPPLVARSCSQGQTRESLDCRYFGFELRLTRGEQLEILDNGSRTECGCIQNLANFVDAATRERIGAEVIEGCRCTKQR